MSGKVKGLEADVVVVGSGPGGATVARDLTKGGKKVIICEAGKYITSLGKFYSPGLLMKKGGLTYGGTVSIVWDTHNRCLSAKE
jgi:choline dehydrogenase-like flavoprotein